jgi:hypothetical protein
LQFSEQVGEGGDEEVRVAAQAVSDGGREGRFIQEADEESNGGPPGLSLFSELGAPVGEEGVAGEQIAFDAVSPFI